MGADDVDIEVDGGLDSAVEGSNAAHQAAVDFANKIADQWRADAPVGDGDTAGAYRDGIIVQETKSGARVVSTDFTSAWNEFGAPTNGEPARFIGRTAALKVGAVFDKKGR